MQLSPSWEADRLSTSQEIPLIYGTRRFITAFTNACHLSPSSARSIQSMPPKHFLKVHLNITHPSTSGSSKLFLSLTFPHQNFAYFPLRHTCYIRRPSHFSWFGHPNNICWGVQTIKLLVMWLSTRIMSKKNPYDTIGNETRTIRFVAQCFNQLRHRLRMHE